VFEHDELIERVAAELRRPPVVDPGLDARVMAAVAAERGWRRRAPLVVAWDWLWQPRTVRLSPLAGLVAAAAVVSLLVWHPWSAAPHPGPPQTTEVRFVYVDGSAGSVVLVGDFNDWNPAATPLRRAPEGGVWTAVVPLEPGRYRYAFMIDGNRWATDPVAPRAGGDDFGTPNSVITVAGAS